MQLLVYTREIEKNYVHKSANCYFLVGNRGLPSGVVEVEGNLIGNS